MAHALLARHPVLATRDMEQARTEVASRFCDHRLEFTTPGGRLDMVHNAAPVGRDVVLNYLRYGDEVRITPGTFDDFFLVQVPLAGRARVRVGGTTVLSDRRRASIGSPTEPVDMVWSGDCEQLLVYIRRTAVEEAAAACPDTPAEVVFDPRMDLDTAALRSWMRLVRLAVEDLDAAEGMFAVDAVATHYEQALIAGLLQAQPNTSRADVPAQRPGHQVVRRAVDLIEAEPERAWRIADLAASVDAAPRTLQEAFRSDLGRTPLEHVRLVRLGRARADLVAADPGSTSVTDVATRWGFFHLGRFASTYREQFSESPSQTLAG